MHTWLYIHGYSGYNIASYKNMKYVHNNVFYMQLNVASYFAKCLTLRRVQKHSKQ